MRPGRAFLARSSLRALSRLPWYFGRGDGFTTSLANTAIALRRFPETVIYDLTFGHPPNYMAPRTYTEKVQWRKLFDRNPEWVVWCDKLAGREMARTRAPGVKVPGLLWVGTDPDEMPLEDLRAPFVVKANNRSAAVVLVETEADLDPDGIREACRKWLEAGAHRSRVYEWGYGRVETKIYIEEYLSREDVRTSPRDLKLFVFDGEVAHLYMRDVFNRRAAVHTPAWRRYDWDRWEPLVASGPTPQLDDFPRPEGLEDAVAAARLIAADLDHLRVDLYDIDGTIYFGEATVYPSSGNKQWFEHGAPRDPYPPDVVDRVFGDLWTLPKVPRRTMLWRGLVRYSGGAEDTAGLR